jgi:glycosyltransferase involved in cell wall biosynthesis
MTNLLTPLVEAFADNASLELKAGDAGARESALIKARVWVVIPCFKVKDHITDVLDGMPSWVAGVVIVDDKCPVGSVEHATAHWSDSRLHVERHLKNQGVGAAVMTGFARAVAEGAGIIVKVDGDNQMDLRMLPALVLPIAAGLADYTKGNRFSSLSHVRGMPGLRVFGNATLSLMAKVSTGYWNIFDPTNGYTGIDARVAKELLGKKIAKRYFFESDLLYHLGTIRAVVKDVPIPAIYGDERSNLKIFRIVFPFLWYHTRNAIKRFIGQYCVRDFSVATLEFILGFSAILTGVILAAVYQINRVGTDAASPGTVMAVVAPVIIGFQMLLAAVNFDVLNVPKEPISKALRAMDEYLFMTPAKLRDANGAPPVGEKKPKSAM